MVNSKHISTKLLHCFGSEKGEKVTPDMAAKMIQTSGIHEIPVNTHNINYVSNWKELKLGYGDATWNTLEQIMDMSQYQPLWNINLPQNAQEAQARAEKAVALGGDRPIKFEVLDSTYRWSNNKEVLKGVDYLVNNRGFTVWPLIAPNYNDFMTLQEWNCPIIRIMGSPISSNNGILPENVDVIKAILKSKKAQVMLDGGVGTLQTIKDAFILGFDMVLVNSWLFSEGEDALKILAEIKTSI